MKIKGILKYCPIVKEEERETRALCSTLKNSRKNLERKSMAINKPNNLPGCFNINHFFQHDPRQIKRAR
jgi:hypothetical protein